MDEEAMEAQRLMEGLYESELDKPKYLGCNHNYKLIYIPGEHGRICLIVPKEEPEPEDLSKLNRALPK